MHCMKSVRIRSYSGPHFPIFGLNTKRYGVSPYTRYFHISVYTILHISPYSVRMRENAHQNNSKYGHFLRSVALLLCKVLKQHSALLVVIFQCQKQFPKAVLETGCLENVLKIPRKTSRAEHSFSKIK